MHPSLINDVDGITCWFSVMKCALAQPKESDDWRRSIIFQALTRISDKNCRVIIDSESCVNTVVSSMVTKVGLKVVPHPQLYKVLERTLCPLTLKKYILSRSNLTLIQTKFGVI